MNIKETAYNRLSRKVERPAEWWYSPQPFWVPHRRGWTEVMITCHEACQHPLMIDQVLDMINDL